MFTLIILLCLFYILKYPAITVKAAANGLVLWFEQVIPALLPFAILSNIMISSNILPSITGKIAPILRLILPVSDSGAFVLLSGFLFGFPMGSKNCAELLRQNKIEKQEAQILFVLTNNISPAFIQSYLLTQQLKLPHYFGLSLLILYLPPLIFAKFLLHKKNAAAKTLPNHKKTASRSKINFQIIDAGIMNGFETLTKIGGYIMIFSILASCCSQLAIPEILKICCIGATELTNGIYALSHSSLSIEIQYVLAMIFTAFGGISGLAQTSAMIKDTELSMKTYICLKLLLCILSGLLALILIQYLTI